jgi:dienelactone hydrolase
MLFCSFDAKSVRNEQERNALLEKTDLSKHVNSKEVNQFICYGTADTFVNFEGAKEYIKSATEKNVNLQVKVLQGQPHAFNKALCLPEFIEFLNTSKK